MPKLKIRKKKYNPNKRSPSELRELQKNAELKKQYEQNLEHGMLLEMEYIGSEVKKYIDQKKIEEKQLIDQFSSNTILPFHIALGSYGYQDLAIACVLDQIMPCEWYVPPKMIGCAVSQEPAPCQKTELRDDQQRVVQLTHSNMSKGMAWKAAFDAAQNEVYGCVKPMMQRVGGGV